MTRNSAPQVFKGGWDELQNTVFTDNTNTISTNPKSFFIKPDGTTIFVINDTTVQTFPLSLPTWDVDSIQSVTNTFTITEDATPTGIYFRDNGSIMFIVGQTTQTLYQYFLEIPWDTSSIVESPVSLSLSAVTNPAIQCVFSRDGDFVFITDNDSVFSFPLPAPWDINSNVSNSFFDPDLLLAISVAFKTEGDKMYIGDSNNDLITEFDLTAPFDISSPTATGNVLDLTPDGIEPRDIFWRTTGDEFFVLDTTPIIQKYHLEDAWNISTASYFSNTFDTGATGSRAVNWRPDGLLFFVLNNASDTVTAFSVTTPFNITNATTLANPLVVTAQEPNPQGIWWKNDGTRLYLIGQNQEDVFQYNTTVAWSVDPANMTFSTAFDPQIGFNPTGLFFSPDGLKMYISDNTGDGNVLQWNLSAPYVLPLDDTLPNKVKDFSASDNISPRDIFIKPDGTQAFFASNSPNDEVIRYTFSTPFDIETVILQDRFDISGKNPNPQGLYIRPNNGKQLFTCGSSSQNVFSFDMSLEFNNNFITLLGDELITNADENLAA